VLKRLDRLRGLWRGFIFQTMCCTASAKQIAISTNWQSGLCAYR